MTLEHQQIQNSEVYPLGSAHQPALPPPSPPSPATPCERSLSPPLDDIESITPSDIRNTCPDFSRHLSNAVHVLGTEATALSYLTRLYETDPIARSGFNSSVDAITRFRGEKGKLVICGIGKSGHIAKKLVATMNSLKIHSTYLHPTEALHGDLGKVGEHDTILLITFSGKTPELLALLPFFDPALPVIVMTSHVHPSTCEIIKRRASAILLPAPIHKSETDSFGFNAPTTSTTMAIALGDAFAVVISNELHINVQAVFLSNHPGGAIGASTKTEALVKVEEICTAIHDIPEVTENVTGAHVLMSAYRSKSGWVKLGNDIVAPPGRIERLNTDQMEKPAAAINGLLVERGDWVEIGGGMEVSMAKEWIKGVHCDEDTVLAVIVDGEAVGIMERVELMAS